MICIYQNETQLLSKIFQKFNMPHPNPPAFPCPGASGKNEDVMGMTLLDYFATAALQGMLANNDFKNDSSEAMAKVSYLIARAMLAERAKETK